MKRHLLCLATLCALLLFSCSKIQERKLLKAMQPMAEAYLDTCGVSYDYVQVDCVDTITEYNYANLNIELLRNMEQNFQMQYEDALVEDTLKASYLRLYLGEIRNTIKDFQELMGSGDLDSKEVLLYMVSGTVCKGQEKDPIMFFVYPDKMTLHTLDPFGNNLLYRDEQ